jgi:two-component sensor histidine kinase
MFGYTMEEMVQLNVSDIHPAELIPQVAAMFETIGTIEKPMAQNFPCLRNDGSVFYADIVGSPVVIDQRKLNVGFFTDTTERKLAEDALKASLREKEILLREIHHRVKNNLQLISSLLRLQSRQIEQKDEILVEMFEDIQGRIKAIALVHEALYRSENLELIDMSQYLQGIVAGLRTVSTQSMQELRINTDVKNISMGINAALACGLIVNELVTNSLKHAFPKGREGKIVVTLSTIGEEEFQLTVHDNGIGMPKYIDLRQPESLGLDLVVSLAEQLHGSVEFTGGEGTEVRVRFREQTNSSDSH